MTRTKVLEPQPSANVNSKKELQTITSHKWATMLKAIKIATGYMDFWTTLRGKYRRCFKVAIEKSSEFSYEQGRQETAKEILARYEHYCKCGNKITQASFTTWIKQKYGLEKAVKGGKNEP